MKPQAPKPANLWQDISTGLTAVFNNINRSLNPAADPNAMGRSFSTLSATNKMPNPTPTKKGAVLGASTVAKEASPKTAPMTNPQQTNTDPGAFNFGVLAGLLSSPIFSNLSGKNKQQATQKQFEAQMQQALPLFNQMMQSGMMGGFQGVQPQTVQQYTPTWLQNVMQQGAMGGFQLMPQAFQQMYGQQPQTYGPFYGGMPNTYGPFYGEAAPLQTDQTQLPIA